MALPKHKVYKGAPNFVYAVFSANQVLAALPAEQRGGLSPGSFKQCAAAPPQLEADAAGTVAYFVCDVSAHGLCWPVWVVALAACAVAAAAVAACQGAAGSFPHG